ncbi:MAG: sigma-54 dependent transcriptional regulator [Planctomycetes bacterium]|nr:sigma-54 dependent transcriptional regulator [Planctomycetota bacterium]
MPEPLLIIDDNEGVFESLEMNFQRDGIPCLWADNREKALSIAENHRLRAAIIDLSLGSESGLDAMRSLLQLRPDLPVVFISGYGTLESAVQAVKMGAYDFLPKPLNFKKLRQVLYEAIRAAGRGGDTARASHAPQPASSIVFAEGGAVAKLLAQAERVADSDLPLLITGESGTGKELFAEYVHQASCRAAKPLVRINCSAINDSLAESELFGHVKGAFTGAAANHQGFFQQANGGSVHMDEIGDMSLATQARVLRVIEDGAVRPVGGSGEIAVDARIIATTNKDLEAMSRDGRFRLDLFYRLNGVELAVPPLRDRPEDIQPLLEHFLAQSADGMEKSFSPKALDALASYQWPGNVREMRNVVKASVLLNPGPVVEFDHLPRALRAGSNKVSGRLEDAEREMIGRVLDEVGGNRKAAAKRLGISLRTLYYKLERYEF